MRNHIDELRRRNVPDGDPSILVEQELIEQLQADLAKMKARQQALSATAESAATLVNNIEAFVERARRLALTAAVTAVRRKGATVLEALDEIRAKIADEKDRLRAARVAPLPSSEAKAKAVGEIEALAERGRPDVTPVVDTGREIGFPTRAGDHVSLSQRTAYASENDQIDAVALVAWAFKEQLIAAIEREIDDNCDDVSALSKEERDVAIASAVADQLRLEREEESLVIIAIDSGLQVQRRADADPRAVLGLTDESGAL